MSLDLSNGKTDYLIKHSSAIHVGGDIKPGHMKAWNACLWNAYKDLSNEDVKEHFMSWRELSWYLDYADRNDAELKGRLRALLATPVEWDLLNEDGDIDGSTMIASLRFRKNGFKYSFSPVMREKCYRPEVYAKISILMQQRIKGHAYWLYELGLNYFIRKNGYGSTPWFDIQTFKKLMHLKETEYPQFKDLNKAVIKKPLARLNRDSDIIMTPDFRKKGRTITEIRFTIRKHPENMAHISEMDQPAIDVGQEKMRWDSIRNKLLDLGLEEHEVITFRKKKGLEYLEKGFLLLGVQKNVDSKTQWIRACYSSKQGYDFNPLLQKQEQVSRQNDNRQKLLRKEAILDEELAQQRKMVKEFRSWASKNPKAYQDLAEQELSNLHGFVRDKLQEDSAKSGKEILEVFMTKSVYRSMIQNRWQQSELGR